MKKNTILYAEDEETSRLPVLILFKEEFPKTNIEVFEDGLSLEKRLRGNLSDDVIVTDDAMPGKDGLDVIRDNSEIIKNIPTFMYYSGGEDIGEKAIQYGTKDYFIKPNVFPLIEEMRKYLG